jgi:hypothetical protein
MKQLTNRVLLALLASTSLVAAGQLVPYGWKRNGDASRVSVSSDKGLSSLLRRGQDSSLSFRLSWEPLRSV